jgi:hypothetical protein
LYISFHFQLPSWKKTASEPLNSRREKSSRLQLLENSELLGILHLGTRLIGLNRIDKFLVLSAAIWYRMVVFAIDPLDEAFTPPRASDHAKQVALRTKKAALALPRHMRWPASNRRMHRSPLSEAQCEGIRYHRRHCTPGSGDERESHWEKLSMLQSKRRRGW